MEARALGRTWWCHGGGAAVLMLLVVVSFFRAPHDVIFWVAIAFFCAHTALCARRYILDRRARVTATVIRHHRTHPAVVPPVAARMTFTPIPVTSSVSGDARKKQFQQTKNSL